MNALRSVVAVAVCITLAGCESGQVIEPPQSSVRLPPQFATAIAPDGYETIAVDTITDLPPEYLTAGPLYKDFMLHTWF